MEATAQLSPAVPEIDRGYRWDLDVLRVLAILGVVAIHVFGLILGNDELKHTDTWHFGVLLDIGAIWCVPVFVMVSGALVLRPSAHRDGPAAFLRRRAARLLPPLVFWHLVYLVGIRGLLRGEDLQPTEVLINFIDTKVFTALYFLWLILGLYVVAPVLAAFLAAGGPARAKLTAVAACAWTAALVAIPGLTALAGDPRPRSDNLLNLWLLYVGLFVAGYAWRDAQRGTRRWIWAGAGALALLAMVVWQYDARPEPQSLQALMPVGYVTPPTMLLSVLLFVAIIDLCARWNPPPQALKVIRAAGEATFGVFLVHLVFVALIQEFLPEFYADPAPAAKTAMYAVVVVLSFAISLVARRIPVLRKVF